MELLREQYQWFVKGGFLSGCPQARSVYDQCFYSRSRSCPGANHRRIGEGLFYINDIIASSQKPKQQLQRFVMNYNTQLCNIYLCKQYFALKVLYLLTLLKSTKQFYAIKSSQILVLLYLMLYLRCTMHPIETLVKSILSLVCIALQIQYNISNIL